LRGGIWRDGWLAAMNDFIIINKKLKQETKQKNGVDYFPGDGKEIGEKIKKIKLKKIIPRSLFFLDIVSNYIDPSVGREKKKISPTHKPKKEKNMSRKRRKKNVSSCRKAVSVTIVLDGGFYDRLFFFLFSYLKGYEPFACVAYKCLLPSCTFHLLTSLCAYTTKAFLHRLYERCSTETKCTREKRRAYII
jgi:hypothetical protein